MVSLITLLLLPLETLATGNPHARGLCFDCGTEDFIHQHHVVPKILGGVKTVPLCPGCHGKIHGMDFTKHRNLTLLGLQRARRRGVRLGRSPGHRETPETFLAKHQDIVSLLHDGGSVRGIEARTGKAGKTVLKVRKCLSLSGCK